MSGPGILSFLDLPRPWIADLFQHVASGPGGLASAAALSQTCSSLHALSESSAVSYRNIYVGQSISSADHLCWQWLAERQGRITGLTLHVAYDQQPSFEEQYPNDWELEDHARYHQQHDQQSELQPNWERPIQVLSSISDLRLTVSVSGWPHENAPFVNQWLGQHRHLIDHLSADVHISPEALSLQDLVTAAASCRSLGLQVSNDDDEPLNLSCLAGVRGCLVSLGMDFGQGECDQLVGLTTLASVSCLTELNLNGIRLEMEEAWTPLAGLTSLQKLTLDVAASGDPSPLSALTGLTYLKARGGAVDLLEDEGAPFTFSTLQPLSTLQRLESLHLSGCCTATSLEGLAGLSNLVSLDMYSNIELCSLEGASTTLTSVHFMFMAGLQSMAGIEALVQLRDLKLWHCISFTSLLGLTALRRLESLEVGWAERLVSLKGSESVQSLVSLEGIKSLQSLKRIRLSGCKELRSLSGLEQLSMLRELSVVDCAVTSLQPVAEMHHGALTWLCIRSCQQVQEVLLELPHLQPSARYEFVFCNVKQVVVAGKVQGHSRMFYF